MTHGSPDIEEKRWFVLNFIRSVNKPTPQCYIDRFNGESPRVELFAPIIRPACLVNGKVVFRDKLLTYYYVFVRGTFADVKELCASPTNSLSLMLDRGSTGRYGIISDAEMENFKIIARAHTNMIPFFNIQDIDLEEGDVVEVVGGDYAGLRGTFMPKPRSNKGNLVIAAMADMGAIVWDIDAKYVRILEFAPYTRRQYDLVDSFITKLLPILRKFHSQEYLTDKEKSTLAVFNRRMGAAVPASHKAEAKLLATLMCVQAIIGDLPGYRMSSARYESRKSALTNPWTLALNELMLSVVNNDARRLEAAYATINGDTDRLTGTQKQLLAEFRFYLGIE